MKKVSQDYRKELESAAASDRWAAPDPSSLSQSTTRS